MDFTQKTGQYWNILTPTGGRVPAKVCVFIAFNPIYLTDPMSECLHVLHDAGVLLFALLTFSVVYLQVLHEVFDSHVLQVEQML